MSALARTIVQVLTDNQRIEQLGEIAVEVEAIADARLGRQRAKVTSAIPLSDAQIQRIQVALQRRLGQPVVIDVEVDPKILGGLICEVGHLTIDSSVTRQLDALSERLRSNG